MALKNITKLILNFIGGGKVNVPVRFLRSVEIDGQDDGNSGSNKIHTLEILDTIEEVSEQDALDLLLYDGHTPTKEELKNINILNTKIVYNTKEFSIIYKNNEQPISIVGGYDSSELDTASIIEIYIDEDYSCIDYCSR